MICITICESLPPRATEKLSKQTEVGVEVKLSQIFSPKTYSPVSARQPGTANDSYSSTIQPRLTGKNHHESPHRPLEGPRLRTCLMGRRHLQFPNKQIHSSIALPGWFQMPPAELDFPLTFFLIIKNTGHLPSP